MCYNRYMHQDFRKIIMVVIAMVKSSYYVVRNEKVLVKEYQNHIEIFKNGEKLCDVEAVRFSRETTQYRETIVSLAVQSKLEELKQKEILIKALETKGGWDKWSFMN